ncbi:putative membrane protein [Candidatus Burkholderia brachyanthoides]|nr:putative membrane protein [Candidatus Burkholderia brachyanthoides]
MSEPQHPAPFGSRDGDSSGGPRDSRSGAGGMASNESQMGPLDSIPAVGGRLAQLRQGKGWSLDDVSARLKVSPPKLQALEAGDISQMPDRTFAAGIVRSYAKILGADPAPFTQAFRRDGGNVGHNLKVSASAGTGLPRARVSVPLGNSTRRKRSWMWGVLAIVVVLVALVMWHTGGDSAAWLVRLKSSTGAGSSATNSTSSNEEAAGASAVQTPDETAAANTGEASLPEVATSPNEQPMPRPLGTNVLPASSSALDAAQAATSAPAATAKAAASSAAASAPTVAGNGANAVELQVKEDSWFSVRGKDGKEVFSGLVHAGSTQRVQGEAPFKVTVGNVKGVESLSVDGQPVDAKRYASARGNVARLTLS